MMEARHDRPFPEEEEGPVPTPDLVIDAFRRSPARTPTHRFSASGNTTDSGP